MQATPSPAVEGDGVVYTGEQFYEALSGYYSEYRSVRGEDGWETRGLTPPGHAGQYHLIAAAPGLTRFVVAFHPTGEGEAGSYRDVLLEEGSRELGALQALIPVTVSHLRAPEEFGEPVTGGVGNFLVVAGSRDFSRLFFAADDALLSGGPLVGELDGDVEAEIVGGEKGGYVYEWHGGVLSLASVLPNGKVAKNALLGQEYEGEGGKDLEHVVSENGLRVFWSSEGNLYVRERSELNENEVSTREVAAGGAFLGASPDGSRVFFLSASGEALDEYDTTSGVTSVIASEGMSALGSGSGEYGGLVGSGDQGEYVYFVDHAALAGETNAQGKSPTAGAYNLYVYEPGGGGHVLRFIATLTRADNEPQPSIGVNGAKWLGVWARAARDRTSEVSPDGRFLAFGSHVDLTGVVNSGPQVFVYDAGTGGLACASCDPSGASNAGTFLPPFYDGQGLHEQRYMLDDGSVFFTTPSALLPGDGNSVDDVYEWEAGGLYLVSPGDVEDPAVLADVSEDGSDVFFTTGEPLVSQDQDGVPDLYDARVDGGLPAVAAPEECAGGCRGPVAPAPVFAGPSSTGLSGAGNLPPSVPVRTAAQVRAEKLAKALKACRRKPRRQRGGCEKKARRLYGAKSSAKRAKSGGRGK
jgi:hypothetical protein